MTDSMPRPAKVSVIIPCFKQAHFLPQALDSVLAQIHRDLECIVVNDGSPDNTREVVTEYMACDNRVKYVEQPNRGLSAARNRGITEATGSYIQFLDSDDLIEPGKLRAQVELLSAEPRLSLSFSDYRCCDRDDISKPASRDNFPPPDFIMGDPIRDLIIRWETQFSIPPHCFLFDARFFTDHGIRFDETLRTHEDWDCWMQIFKLRPIIRRASEKLAIYRLHGQSMCGTGNAMWEGYSAALKKQRRNFRDESQLAKLIDCKFLEMQRIYGEVPPTHLMRLTGMLVRLYRKSLPWPIQQAISKSTQRKSSGIEI